MHCIGGRCTQTECRPGDPARGALSLGAFSFVQKPIDGQRLAATIGRAIGPTPGNGAHPGPHATALYVGCLPQSAGGADARASKEKQAVASKLAELGVALLVAETPSEAVALTITRSPALIVIDMTMPDADLFELISAIKGEEEAARIPVLLLSEELSDQGIHFHLGSDVGDSSVSLDYICEQLSRVLTSPEP